MNADPHDQTNAKSLYVPSYKILIKHTFLTGSGWLLSSKLETKLTQLPKYYGVTDNKHSSRRKYKVLHVKHLIGMGRTHTGHR